MAKPQRTPGPLFDSGESIDVLQARLRAIGQKIKRNRHDAQEAFLDNPIELTQRDEANVLTAYAFRNGYLESLHTGVAGFADEEMKKLMIESSAALTDLLYLRQSSPADYAAFLLAYGQLWCSSWDRGDLTYRLPVRTRSSCRKCENDICLWWEYCATCGAKLRGRSSKGEATDVE